MFSSNRPLRAFFSGVFAAPLVASMVAAQDSSSGPLSSLDAPAFLIPKLNPPMCSCGCIGRRRRLLTAPGRCRAWNG